jgi:hypothetical protein
VAALADDDPTDLAAIGLVTGPVDGQGDRDDRGGARCRLVYRLLLDTTPLDRIPTLSRC